MDINTGESRVKDTFSSVPYLTLFELGYIQEPFSLGKVLNFHFSWLGSLEFFLFSITKLVSSLLHKCDFHSIQFVCSYTFIKQTDLVNKTAKKTFIGFR